MKNMNPITIDDKLTADELSASDATMPIGQTRLPVPTPLFVPSMQWPQCAATGVPQCAATGVPQCAAPQSPQQKQLCFGSKEADATSARKRRRDIMLFRRAAHILMDGENGFDPYIDQQPSLDGERPEAKEHILPENIESREYIITTRGVRKKPPKKQKRYDPGVPMTKEELSEWRREKRRIRNRESAARSRKETRQRIEELEKEVNMWRQKYTKAIERIHQLERGKPQSDSSDTRVFRSMTAVAG